MACLTKGDTSPGMEAAVQTPVWMSYTSNARAPRELPSARDQKDYIASSGAWLLPLGLQGPGALGP